MRYSLKIQKICRCHALGMLHIHAQKIFVPGQDDVYIRDNGGVKNGLIFCIPDQLFRMVNSRDQLIRQFRQQDLGVRQVFRSLPLQDVPDLHNIPVA